MYPGKGLSLSQLVFALNEELKRVAYSPLCVNRFTSEAVSQLDRDASVALATIREWRNTFVPINRLPLDIISLIPTYSASHRDRFRAASVCRHWRSALLEHGPLWSQLFLKKGEDYVSTLLKRAKGSALHIIANRNPHANVMALLLPRAQQIRYLEFAGSYWKDVLLEAYNSDTQYIAVTPSSRMFSLGPLRLSKPHYIQLIGVR